MGQDLSLEELEALNNAIKTRHGIDFTHYEPASFGRRVSRAISYFGCANLMEMWTKLLRDKSFLFDFIDQITVGMTSMFRDPQMWKVLKNDLFIQLKQNTGTIEVLHAGCSTGEETYSLGIVLQDLKIQDRVRAKAVDLNRDSIKISEAGLYDKLTLRQNEKQFSEYNPFKRFSQYYKDVDAKHFQMDKSLVSHCSYEVGNLVADDLGSEKYDIIFCRNVLIYFDSTLKKRTLEKFYKALKPNGFLVIGYFDALLPVIDKDLWEYYNLGAKIFRKI